MAKESDVEDLPAAPGEQKKLNGLLPIIAIIVLIPLITVGLWEFYMLPSLEKLANQGGSPAAGVKHGGSGSARTDVAQTYEFNDIVANLSGSLKSRYIKVSFTVEGRTVGFPEHMARNRAKIIDGALAVLSDLSLQDLEKPGIKNIVRNDLLNTFGQTLQSDIVEQLYFSEFVVQ